MVNLTGLSGGTVVPFFQAPEHSFKETLGLPYQSHQQTVFHWPCSAWHCVLSFQRKDMG